MQGPFKVLRVTSQGNVFIQSAPSRPGKPAPQWSVRADQVVPYRFAHHTNVSHPSVGTACILPPSRLPQPTTSDFFLLVLRFRFYRLVYVHSVYSVYRDRHSVHSVRGACGIHHACSLLSHFPCADDYSLPRRVLRLPPIRLRAFICVQIWAVPVPDSCQIPVQPGP